MTIDEFKVNGVSINPFGKASGSEGSSGNNLKLFINTGDESNDDGGNLEQRVIEYMDKHNCSVEEAKQAVLAEIRATMVTNSNNSNNDDDTEIPVENNDSTKKTKKTKKTKTKKTASKKRGKTSVEYSYYENGQIQTKWTEKPNGDSIQEDYDEDGNLISKYILRANGSSKDIEYYKNGKIRSKIVKSKDGSSIEEKFHKDGKKRKTVVYDKNDNIVYKIKDYEYDENGNIISQTKRLPGGQKIISKKTYDKKGKVLSRKEEYYNNEILTQTEEYDKNDKLKQTIGYNPDGSVKYTIKNYKYDESGNIISKTKIFSTGEKIFYTTTTDESGEITTIAKEYDSNGILTQIQEYDKNDKLKQTVVYNPDGSIKHTIKDYMSDDSGNIISKTIILPTGEKTKYSETLDDNGNTISKEEEYDKNGRLKQAVGYNPDGSINYTINNFIYDESGNLLSQEKTLSTGEKIVSKRTVDESGNVTINVYKDEKLIYTSSSIDGKIDAFKQGQTGDCWLLSGIYALSSTPIGENIIKDSIKVNDDGSVTVSFKGIGVSYTIPPEEIALHDTDSNLGDAYSNGDNDVLAIELATEKLVKDIYSNKISVPLDFNLLQSTIANGGYPQALMYYFAGIKLEDTILLAELPYIDAAKIEELFNQLDENNATIAFSLTTQKHSAVCVDGSEFNFGADGWNSAHAFAVKSINKNNKTVTFINPWDSSKEYTMTFSEFAKIGISDIRSYDTTKANLEEIRIQK